MPRALPLLALLLLGAALADPLPPGVQRQGNVITMQPIGDSDAAAVPQDTDAERRPGAQRVLTPADHDIFTRAFDAADRGDWASALSLAGSGQNAMAKKLVQWRYLQDKNGKAPFAAIDAFLGANNDWPRRNILLVRAEEALDPATPPATVTAWFGTRNPISATGMIRLGDALIAAGKASWGQKLVRDGWAAGTFEPDQELAIVQKDGAFLTPDVDRRRLDNLIWGGQLTDARREMSRVDEAAARVANARILVRSDPRRADRAISELSADLANDPRLLFDRARAARRHDNADTAADLLLRPNVRELFKTRPGALWAETHIVAREELKNHKADVAYRLVSGTGLSTGSDFADAEFLSGWIALRFLSEPRSALPHFQALTNGVSRPISKARGNYWLGRTYEALGDNASAYQSYALASTAHETFYGQLALPHIDATPTMHISAPARVDVMPAAAVFERDDLVRAMRVLGDLGAQELLRTFALRYLELHPDAAHAKQLAQALTDMGFRDVALRVAKVQGYDGPTFPQFSYPTIVVPAYQGPDAAPEPALVHAIIRQETEFDPQSVSHANARGIMQLTLPSARANAKRAGLPYKPNALTTDVTYNMQLGMTEFSGYLANWGHSVILSAAAYNAGENAARRWIQEFGDPRSPSTDPIDWTESITYGETRNYVQRIVENLEVYRARLAGHDVPLRILSDIYAPNSAPAIKVLSPPPPPPPAPEPTPKPSERQAATK